MVTIQLKVFLQYFVDKEESSFFCKNCWLAMFFNFYRIESLKRKNMFGNA